MFSGEGPLQQLTADLRPFLCIILHNGPLGAVTDLWQLHPPPRPLTPSPPHPGGHPRRFHLQWAGPGLVSLGPSGCSLPERQAGSGSAEADKGERRRERRRAAILQHSHSLTHSHTHAHAHTHTHTRPLHSAGSDAGESGCGNTRRLFHI